MNEMSNEKFMTVKEVAELLGVSHDLITKRVKELYPDSMEHGKKRILNEKEVTAVKMRIQQNSSLATHDDRRKLAEMPKTELEKKLLVSQAMRILQEDIEQLKSQVNVMQPKALFYDMVTDSKDSIDMSEASKVLNLGIGRNKLFQLLRKEKILMKDNIPYQQFIDRGFFRVIESKYNLPDGSIKINLKTVVYQSGLEFISKKIKQYKEVK